MKKYFLSLTLLLASAICLIATPAKDEVLAAITVLEGDFFNQAGADAAKTVTQFAQESDAVMIGLGTDTAPWVVEKEPATPPAVRQMLLAAYLAGNIKSQLSAGKPEDDPYAGWLLVMSAYRKFQAKRPLTIPSIERLSEMESKGQLKEHAKKVVSKKPAA